MLDGLIVTAEFLVFSAFHRKCIDPWLTKTKHTCPLCKKRVFRRTTMGDDSDSDDGSVEDSSTNPSERTPLLASGAFSTATNASATGATSNVAVTTVDVSSDDGLAPEPEQRWGQSSVEVHRAESPRSLDEHVAGTSLVIDAGEPVAGASCNITVSADTSASVSDVAVAHAGSEASSSWSSSCVGRSSQHITA